MVSRAIVSTVEPCLALWFEVLLHLLVSEGLARDEQEQRRRPEVSSRPRPVSSSTYTLQLLDDLPRQLRAGPRGVPPRPRRSTCGADRARARALARTAPQRTGGDGRLCETIKAPHSINRNPIIEVTIRCTVSDAGAVGSITRVSLAFVRARVSRRGTYDILFSVTLRRGHMAQITGSSYVRLYMAHMGVRVGCQGLRHLSSPRIVRDTTDARN